MTSHCYEWLLESLPANASLSDANEQFRRRNVVGIIFVLLLCIMGCIGNMHVLLIYILKFKSSNYRVYILCLATLDMINCTISMPLTIVYLSYYVMFPSHIFCKFYRFVIYYVSIASTFILIIIAVDRYRKIHTPLKRQLSVTDTVRLCMAGLVLGLLFAWPAPVVYGHSSMDLKVINVTGYRCFTEDNLKHGPFLLIFNIVLTTVFLFILSVLIFLYYFILKAVRHHVRFTLQFQMASISTLASLSGDETLNSNAEEQRNIRDMQLRRTTITLLSVTIGYVLSALPHHVLALVIFSSPEIDCNMSFAEGTVYYTFIWIFLVNNVVNPVIYSFGDKRFWRKIKRLYCRKKKENIMTTSSNKQNNLNNTR